MLVTVSGGMPGPLSSTLMRVGIPDSPLVMATLMTGAISASSQASMPLSTSSLAMTRSHS
jgi:hypothetical protein